MRWGLVVFDFDGTLADTYDWFRATLDVLADRFGFRKPGPDEIETLRGLPAERILSHLGVRFWKVGRIAVAFREAQTRDIGTIRPFPGVLEALDALDEAGLELAVASSNDRHNIEALLGDRAKRIRHWECGVSLQGKAAHLRRLLRHTKADPERVILVGDELRDAEAARKAGIAFGAVSWGYNHLEALAEQVPDLIFRTPEDLHHLIA